jgi:hypothetical protein
MSYCGEPNNKFVMHAFIYLVGTCSCCTCERGDPLILLLKVPLLIQSKLWLKKSHQLN